MNKAIQTSFFYVTTIKNLQQPTYSITWAKYPSPLVNRQNRNKTTALKTVCTQFIRSKVTDLVTQSPPLANIKLFQEINTTEYKFECTIFIYTQPKQVYRVYTAQPAFPLLADGEDLSGFWGLCVRVPVVTLLWFYVLVDGQSSRVLVDEIHVGSSSGPDDVHGALV